MTFFYAGIFIFIMTSMMTTLLQQPLDRYTGYGLDPYPIYLA